MRDPLPLPLDSKYQMFCFLIIKQCRVCKINVRFDLQKFPILPLTGNLNPCNPWIFQPMVYKWSVGAMKKEKISNT